MRSENLRSAARTMASVWWWSECSHLRLWFGTNNVADVKLRRTAWWHVRRAGWRDRSSWRLSERNISMSEVTTEKQGSNRPDTRGYDAWSSASVHLPFNMRFVIRASLSRETQLPTLLWTATVNTGGLMWIWICSRVLTLSCDHILSRPQKPKGWDESYPDGPPAWAQFNYNLWRFYRKWSSLPQLSRSSEFIQC